MTVAPILVGTRLYLFIGDVQVHCSVIFLFYAVMRTVVTILCYMIGIKVLSLESLAIYSTVIMLDIRLG